LTRSAAELRIRDGYEVGLEWVLEGFECCMADTMFGLSSIIELDFDKRKYQKRVFN
jgi:hypothetical protein